MTLILTQADVRALLSMETCIELAEQSLLSLARGTAQNPLRSALWKPDRSGLLGLMPGYDEEAGALGLKVVGVFPGNHGGPLDSHQGLVALFDTENGSPLAILEASEITAQRTAAVSALATRILAPEGARELALLGSGVQARTHLTAMLLARPFERVRVYSPKREHRERFAEQTSAWHGLEVESVDSPQAAVAQADVICTLTSSPKPVLLREWIHGGVHINAAGACTPKARELNTPLVQAARLFVDRRESALNEAGDFLIPQAEGVLGPEHILGELGELLLGEIPGRRNAQEITLFKSLGLAVEDLRCASYLVQEARRRGLGVEVDLSGRVAPDAQA